MTVGVTDLVKLHFSPGMISSGITFACRAHLRMFTTQHKLPASRLRHLCSQSIASLAIRHWLSSEGVPHSLHASAPVTNPHLKQVTLGGRSVHVVTLPIFNRNRVRELREHPRMLLRCIVREGDLRHIGPHITSGDLLAFSVLVSNVCQSVADSRRRMANNEQLSAIAVPPRAIWRQQRPWRGLGPLIVHNPGTELVHFEINGLGPNRSLVVERLNIAGDHFVENRKHLNNLLYLSTDMIPTTSPRIECSGRKTSWRVTPGAWSNLWFYEPILYLAGWLTKGDVDQVFKSVPRNLRVRKTPRVTQIRIRDLRPIGELVKRLRHM